MRMQPKVPHTKLLAMISVNSIQHPNAISYYFVAPIFDSSKVLRLIPVTSCTLTLPISEPIAVAYGNICGPLKPRSASAERIL